MRKATLIFLLVFSISSVYSQMNRNRLDEYLFKIAIYGPSDEMFIWWGHAALIIEDTRWNYSRVFDWGLFSYPSDNFIYEFIREQVQYSVSAGPLDMDEYINEDRDITIFTLDLDRMAKELILDYAENRVLPENRYYDYHQFLDNCATGIRDIIDLGLRGQLKNSMDNVQGRLSFRQHVRRFTWFRPFPDWFFDFLMGQYLDKQISPWDEMFLPVEIARNIENFIYIDEFGKERKLVSSVELLYSSKYRPPVLHQPLNTWPFFLIAGLSMMGFFFALKSRQKKFPLLYRIVWGVSQSFLGLFFGIIGLVLFFGMFLMNNDYFQHNFNIFFVNPILLLIVPLGILSALNKSFLFNPDRGLRIIWTYVFITGSLIALLKILPFFFQQNQSVYGLILPIAFALSNVPEKLCKYIKNINNE